MSIFEILCDAINMTFDKRLLRDAFKRSKMSDEEIRKHCNNIIKYFSENNLKYADGISILYITIGFLVADMLLKARNINIDSLEKI